MSRTYRDHGYITCWGRRDMDFGHEWAIKNLYLDRQFNDKASSCEKRIARTQYRAKAKMALLRGVEIPVCKRSLDYDRWINY